MAEQTKGFGSTKRYGVRYGIKLKGKIESIEAERRLSTKCPYCHYPKATRVSTGIWECRKCKASFTGKAYTTGGTVPASTVEEVKPSAAEATAKEQTESYEEEEQESLQSEERNEEE